LGIGDESEHNADKHDENSKPQPRNERVQMCLDDGAAGVRVLSFKNDV
jgi:hypothetical protein